MKPLEIYTFQPQSHTASYYYRLTMPIKAMNDLGLPVRAMVDTDLSAITSSDRVHAFCEADIALMYQPVGEGPLSNVRNVRTFIPSKRDDDWKWGPSLVMETDDNLFHVSVLNPAYGNLGTKDPNGNEIPPGNNIGVVQNGQRVVKWIDGHVCDGKCGPNGNSNCGRGIDLARNRESLNCYRRIIELMDAVQCSTPGVADALSREVTPKRLKIFPNLVRFEDYEQIDLAPHPGEVRILWQGGQNHYEDWYPLRKALGRVTKKYPQVQWVIWGALYHWVMEEIPAERFTFKQWVPYPQFRDRLAMIGHDISLAPLSHNPFNACRSAIKWYESSVLKRPAATLAQDTGPYHDEIQDGKTGLLFSAPEEFEEKLSLLIELEDERRELAQNAKQWISEHRNAIKCVPEIYEFWRSLRSERKLEQPHVSDEEWAVIEKQAEEEERELREAQEKRKQVVYI